MTAIEQLRKHAGITQAQLGEAIGKTGVTISRYETGKRSPSIETLRKLAVFFGVSVDRLIRGAA